MMTRVGRVVFALAVPTTLGLLLVRILLLMLSAGQGIEKASSLASTHPEAGSTQQTVTLLVDDFEPQPIQGNPFWPHNRLGGDRGPIGDEAPPQDMKVHWGQGVVTATITGVNTGVGVWTSLNHPIADHTPLDFSAIFPSQIKSEYQGRITGLAIRIRDGVGNLTVELKAPGEVVRWEQTVSLTGGQRELSFNLPTPGLTETQNLNWLIEGNIGDFVVVDQIVLTATVPELATDQQAFLWSYAMLLANWDPESGLTRDGAHWAAHRFDNVSASGMQAAAAVMAWRSGFISETLATNIVESTTQGLLALPCTCHGLWPHFSANGQIVPGTEWSSIDTVIAAVALIEAREALSLDTTQAEAVLAGIDWSDLITPSGSISGSIGHGYWSNCQPIGAVWRDFGTESWLVNLGYAAATGKVADFDHTPPTYNGSGFIDELAWLLAPPPYRDRWGTLWRDYRQQAADCQLAYYEDHLASGCLYHWPQAFYQSSGLFGLSAAEVPDLSAVVATQTYQAFGVGGEISPTDGTELFGYAVIVPHYAGMIASLRPNQAITLWNWIEGNRLFTPLNNVECLGCQDEDKSGCEQLVWNGLKGSWNLSLQALGWGRFLVGNDNPLYRALLANDMLRRGYLTMMPGTFLPIIIK